MIVEYIRYYYTTPGRTNVLRVDTESSHPSASRPATILSWIRATDRVSFGRGSAMPSHTSTVDAEVKIISGSGPLPRPEYVWNSLAETEFLVLGTYNRRTRKLNFEPDVLRQMGLAGYTLAKEMMAAAVASARQF